MCVSTLKFFENIPVVPDKNMVLTRLGYKKTKTVFDDTYRVKLDEQIKQGIGLCNTKAVFGRYKIEEWQNDAISFSKDKVFKSESVAKLLKNSLEVVLMASTVGKNITEIISDEIKNGNASFGVVLDSVASQTADGALDWMVDFINKLLRREGKKLTSKRYSPGYGDFPLLNQKEIYNILNLNKLDIEITDRYMLVPEKSVIAIAGIEGIE
ncbi:UNVERIFIED_CONTAM: hypothetical protein Cloal_2258 [Acetivibrio alkalicellulosi]